MIMHGGLLIHAFFCLKALDKCQLGDEVRKKEGKLDSAGLHLLMLA